MKHLSIVLMGLFIISCGKNSSGGSSSSNRFRDPVVSENGAKEDLHRMIDKYRKAGRSPRLRRALIIDNEADIHAQDMSDGRVPYGHYGSQERCMRARRNIGGGNACTEMVARDQYNAEAAFNSWISMPGTRARLLDPRFNYVGIGVANDRFNRVYWTLILLQQ